MNKETFELTQPHVVIVEDDNVLRSVLRDFLSLMGYRVTEACSIAEFRALGASNNVCLVLLDLNLPDGDGLALLGEIINQSNTPVFVVSGRHDENSRLQALEAGANDFLVKPFNARELGYRMRNFLERQKTPHITTAPPQSDQSDRVLATGEWKLFASEYRLTSTTGESINLTRSERDLLRVLIEANGAVCTRRQLAKAMSSPMETTSEETVTVLIYRLRRKLEQSGLSAGLIETVTGVGYRLSLTDTKHDGA